MGSAHVIAQGVVARHRIHAIETHPGGAPVTSTQGPVDESEACAPCWGIDDGIAGAACSAPTSWRFIDPTTRTSSRRRPHGRVAAYHRPDHTPRRGHVRSAMVSWRAMPCSRHVCDERGEPR
jgi:hypothetical protein